MQVRIKENSWMARLAAWNLKETTIAFTLGRTIHLHHCSRSEFLAAPQWVCHELQHVAQFEKYGLIPFTLRYLWESIFKGYYYNKYEIEAREAEQDKNLLHGVEFI
jgi:hypothetical protein